MRFGDFTGLAEKYSKYRPDYSNTVLDAILGTINKKTEDIDFVDVGAGTGIWTNMVYDKRVHSVKAIEPNIDMLTAGKNNSQGKQIEWIRSSAEEINLENDSVDWVSMASSLHWVNFEKSVKEFNRILRDKGIFTALWNPRLISVNPLLLEIENYLKFLNPQLKRRSSGNVINKEELTNKLLKSGYFEDVIYIEGRHMIKMQPDRYLGAWESVNDIQVQLGEEKFIEFINFIEKKISGLRYIEATYLTRSWTAKKLT